MACSLNTGFSVSGSNESIVSCCCKGSLGPFSSVGSLQLSDSRSKEFMGKPLDVLDQKGFSNWNAKASGRPTVVKAQGSLCVSRIMKWWEKNNTPNMIEIKSAQELVDRLLNAGDKLVIIDFYSPGCGGCRAFHPKVCQFAETNPGAIFLKVNNEELKTMCYALRVHVLPFFRFYRGAAGMLGGFSCTISTIKKFKEALARYGGDEYRVGPAKGLEEKEMLALGAAGLISGHGNRKVEISRALPFEHTKKEKMEELMLSGLDLSSALSKDENIAGLKESSAVVMA